MTDLERIQEALNAGYSKEDIRSWYLAQGKTLPKEIDISPEEKTGVALPKPLRLGMTALQGPTFGFADELAGIVQAPFIRQPGESIVDAYGRGRDIYRAGVESYQQESPIGAPVAQGIASLPLGMMNIAKTALPSLGPVARAVTAGGVTGAISGAGEAETVGQIPEKAAVGGAVSSILGGTTEGLMKAVRPVKGAVTSRIAGAVPEQLRQFVNYSSVDLARRRVAQAMLRDGVSPDQIAARMSKLGDDAVIAEAAGMNTRDLLDTMATLPGRTKNLTEELIRTRQAGRGQRITEAAQKQLSPSGERLASTVENLITQRSITASPLYDQLKQLTVNVDKETLDILNAANKLGAFSNAKTIATALRQPFTLGDLKGLTQAAMPDLDMVKRGLDDLIESPKAVNQKGQYTEFGRAVVKLKNDLLRKLDDATTDTETGQSIYKSARDAFAGPSSLISAAELGRTIFNKDADFIVGKIKGMSQSELEAFRVGAFENLRSIAGTQSGQTRLLNMWKEPATQEKLKQIFPSERAYREFASDIAAEARKKGIESVGRGTQTASREARMEDVGVETLKDMGALAAASKSMDIGSLLNMLQGTMQRTVVPESVRNQIGQILTSRATSGDELRILRNVIAEMERKQRGGAATSGIIGSQIGVPAVEPVTEALRSLLQ